MKKNSQSNIFFAFMLNLIFTIVEIVGGIFTNSVAILSDAVHDFGDSLSIGMGWFLEKKANKERNDKFTFGYIRMRVLSAFITCAVLLIGSTFIIYESINRLINPEPINSMWIFIISIFGILFNGLAVLKTRRSDNINEKSINLHILEDVLGWIVVFIGSIFLWLFNITWLDSVMSILISTFVLYHAIKNMVEVFNIFMEKAPNGVEVLKLKEHLLKNELIKNVHHIHVWTLDGQIVMATCHIVLSDLAKEEDLIQAKNFVKEESKEFEIDEIVVEFEFEKELCQEENCDLYKKANTAANTHHHHHHH